MCYVLLLKYMCRFQCPLIQLAIFSCFSSSKYREATKKRMVTLYEIFYGIGIKSGANPEYVWKLKLLSLVTLLKFFSSRDFPCNGLVYEQWRLSPDAIFSQVLLHNLNPDSGGLLDLSWVGGGFNEPTPSRSPQKTVKILFLIFCKFIMN